ncbi:unnamed protein product, partial [marine sediment metagenome]
KNDLEFRGKEKRTPKFRYSRYELFCPKCGEITCITESKSRRYVDSVHLLGRYAGEIGEKLAQKFLVDAGYEIRSFAELASYALCKDALNGFEKSDKILYEGIARLFLRDKYQSFIEFCEVWNKDPDVPTTINIPLSIHRDEEKEEKTFPKGTHVAGLDFVGRKKGKFYLIEVKTNKAVPTKYQKKMLLKSKELGFTPVVLRLKVKISVPEEEIEWKFI